MAKDDRIDRWKSMGILDRSTILARIDEFAQYVIKFASERFPSPTTELDEAAFVSLLGTNGGLPQSCSGFGHLVYSVVAYLSVTPFYRQPGEKSPSSLSLADIRRGLAWVLPDVYHSIVVASNQGRSRTPADYRRLLFQSLATTTRSGPYDEAATLQRASRNARFVVQPHYEDLDWLSTNRDGDGDEMFHDVLDVLYATQPEPNYPIGGLKRDDFRGFAKELTKEYPKFDTLAIPRDRFNVFVTFLVALQFEHQDPAEPTLPRYEEAGKNVVASFCNGVESDVITWPAFDDALKQMPFLFDPLHRIMAASFLREQPFEVSGSWLAPKPPGDSFMTVARLSQLAVMLNQDVDFENFRMAHQWHTGVRPTVEVLLAAIKTMPNFCVMVMCGRSSNGQTFIFGIFDPMHRENREEEGHGVDADEEERMPVVREKDAVHDLVEYRGTERHVARPALFVLSPAQRVVRLREQPRIDVGALHFDDALAISNDGGAWIKNGDKTTSTSLKIAGIEIWGEISTNT